jgi:hypothetical protein
MYGGWRIGECGLRIAPSGPVFAERVWFPVGFSIGAEPLTSARFNCGRIILALRSECFRWLDENIHLQLKCTLSGLAD